jgi:hypothetical protein
MLSFNQKAGVIILKLLHNFHSWGNPVGQLDIGGK